MGRRLLIALLGAVVPGGLGASPQPLFVGACAPTQEGNGCLTLWYTPSQSVRRDAASLSGTLNWGLYRGGDVGPFGPGDHKSLYGDALAADFTNDYRTPNDDPDGLHPVAGEINLADIPAQKYQALGYLDVDENGESSSGDPVTLPKGEFALPADTHMRVTVQLDFLR